MIASFIRYRVISAYFCQEYKAVQSASWSSGICRYGDQLFLLMYLSIYLSIYPSVCFYLPFSQSPQNIWGRVEGTGRGLVSESAHPLHTLGLTDS